jgi:hypothetical protein
LFSLPPPRKIAEGSGIHIVGFRSRQFHRVQDCVKTTHEGDMVPTTRSRGGPAWSSLSFLPRCVPRWLLFLTVFYFPKNDVVESLGPFDVRKVPETQK